MDEREIQNQILHLLSPSYKMYSNEMFRSLRISKPRFHKIRDYMLEQGWIKSEKKKNRLLLSLANFESSKYDEHDWTKITRINCTTFLKYLKDRKPLFTVTKKKKINIRKNKKDILDAFFHELDRQMIVNIRLVNAEALGLIRSNQSRFHQKECVEFVQEYIKKLLSDHKEFKEEIKEYAQSQLRTVQFKI